ncbi:MAG: type I restriction-modification enzyme R subunit C-terminal domain-containing protein [Cyanobacteria bacterium J06638_22]
MVWVQGLLSLTHFSFGVSPNPWMRPRHAYSADQIRFLRAVMAVFLQRRRIEVADLYDEPLDRFGEDAVERLFSEEDIQELVSLFEILAA